MKICPTRELLRRFKYPLWVKNRPRATIARCLLDLDKQTPGRGGDEVRSVPTAEVASSFDHLVGAREERR